MELNTILELVKAGFTQDEIMQMEKPQPSDPNPEPVQLQMQIPVQDAEPVNPTSQVAEPVAPAVPTPVATPAPQPAQQEAQPTMAELMQSIAKLTSAVQANAIAQSVIPAGISNPPKAEDMLAEIIRPTYRGKEE